MRDIGDIKDKNAEGTVVASVIQHPKFILHSDFLRPRCFSDVFNASCYWAVQTLVERDGVDTIDAINLSNMLNSNASVKREVEKYNIKSISDFIDMTSYAARSSVEDYMVFAKQVATLSYRRDLAKDAVMLQNECFDDKATIPDLNKKLSKINDDLSSKYIISDEVCLIGDKVDEMWQNIEDNRNDSGTVGLPSVIPDLNNYIGGYEKGELVLFAAAPKAGKSAVLMNEALHKLKMGASVVYFDSEMSTQQFFTRALASLSSVDVRLIKNGRYGRQQAEAIRKAKEQLKKFHLYHVYMPVPNPDEVYETCKMLKMKNDCDFVVYDYLKIDEATSDRNYNMLGAMTNHLKNVIAGELELPVAGAVQTARDGESIGDSFKIVRYASTIILWQRYTPQEIAAHGGDINKTGTHRMFVQYNRNGDFNVEGDNGISCCFNGNTMQVWEAPVQIKEAENPFDEGVDKTE